MGTSLFRRFFLLFLLIALILGIFALYFVVNENWIGLAHLFYLSLLSYLLFTIYAFYRLRQKQKELIVPVTKTAREVAGGNLDKRVLLKDENGINELAQAVNYMADSLQEKVKELSWSKNRLQAILDNIDSGLIVFNADGKAELANAVVNKILNTAADRSLIGLQDLEIIRSPLLHAKLVQVFRYKKEEFFELKLPFAEEKFLECSLIPLPDAGKGVLLILRDVTRLRKLEKMRSEFVANVSHELRTPLTSIKGFAETLLNGALEDKESAYRFVGTIDAEAERLTKLINDLLDLSRIESGQITFNPVSLDIHEEVDLVLERLEPLWKEKKMTVVNEISPTLNKIKTDKALLQEVLYNLIDNAVKYTPEAGKIIIGAEEEKSGIKVFVRDNGPGIPAEEQDRIFERFYRLDKARSRKLGGTGLGLSIVKHIVENQGGKVGVQSAPHQGSNFWFWLPS